MRECINMEDLPIIWIISSLGFVLGMAFGATAQRTNFCTMGAISDMVFMGDLNRFRSWMLAIAVAITGSQFLHITETIDLNTSIYLTPNFAWAGAIIGGLMFGFGMTMAGGCGNKTLVRLGAGNLKSLVVALVLGIFAYMTVRGLIGLARVELEGATNIDLAAAEMEAQGMPDMLAAAIGIDPATARLIVFAVVVLGLLAFCFKSEEFRSSKRDIAGGLILGALVPVAWYVTGVIGFDDFEPTPLASFTFVNADDMVRHIIGGAIMGVGGILAMGCTIGQGLTGMSTLSAGSLIALASIITGGIYGMKYLEEGNFGGALKAMFGAE